ncbi:MAG: cytochrome C [Candidatus Latescibacteria bacterium]|nr:cytochrome C [Candidatus Latescibacterota bacterium]
MAGTNRTRLIAIVVAVAVMGMLVVVVGRALRPSPSPSPVPVAAETASQGVFKARPWRGALAADMAPVPGTDGRSLDEYYALRAYPGAPPVVPHPVDAEIARTQRCNICHEQGGWVPSLAAYTPLTPHPEYGNCLQCHVLAASDDLFVESNWVSIRRPVLHRPALPGNPPPIPHSLQLRDNCLACHAGPAAVEQIRTSHPERVNCLQCHVPRRIQTVFTRP